MQQSIEIGNFQESLRGYERYQNLAVTLGLSFLFITWKWPWAGKKLIDPPIDIPQTESVSVGVIPFEVSITVAVFLLLSAFLVSSCLALFCIGRAKKLGKKMSDYSDDIKAAILTYPSLVTHDEKIVRIGMPLVISCLILITFAREFWWEGNALWGALGKGAILSLLPLVPQLLCVEVLWKPLISTIHGKKRLTVY